MRAGFMVPIAAAIVAAVSGFAVAQELDNNGRYIPAAESASPAPADSAAARDAGKAAETAKPKPATAKPVERKTAAEKPDTKSGDARPAEKNAAAKPVAVDKKQPTHEAKAEPGSPQTTAKAETKVETKTEAKSEAKSAAKSAAKTEANTDPLSDIPFSQRAAVRAALLWAAGDDAARDGDQIGAAIDAFRKRTKSNVTGPLTAQERETLLAAAKSHDDEFGWRVVTDPATGIRLGLPSKMVPNATLADRGTRWSSRHGEIQIETFRYTTDEPLAAVFARMKSEPANRKVEYSAIRSDNFIISGMQGLRKFSVRAYARDGEVRGFTMRFDQAMEGIVAPVMVAMASAFAPFPGRIAPLAALTRKVEYGTGIVVSATGHIVTDRKLADGCQVIVVSGIGNAEPVARDDDHGLALLRVYGRRNLKPAPLASAAPGNSDLTLVGVPDPHIQNGNDKPSEMKARLSGVNGSAVAIELKDPMPVAGFSGAAALDAQGHVAGMMETRSIMLASADASVPPVRLVPSDTIRKFLAAHRVVTAPDANGDRTSDARDAVVRVICVRQ